MERKIYGRWKTFASENELEGNLIVDEEERVLFLELLIPDPGDDGPTVGIRRGTVIPFIQGSLFGGGSILLHNCTCLDTNGFIGDVLQLVHCEYAFRGLKIEAKDQFCFSEIFVNYDGMLEWTRLGRFESKFDDIRHWSIHWFGEKDVTIKVSDDLDLEFSPVISSSIGMFKSDAEMEQSVTVRFKYQKEVKWDRFLWDMKRVRYLAGFALRDHIDVSEIKYKHPSLSQKSDKNSEQDGFVPPQNVLMGKRNTTGLIASKGRGFFSLFDLESGIQNGAVSKWFDSFDVLEPVLDLLFSALEGQANSETLRFLSYTQALETLHARFVTNDVREAVSKANQLKSNAKKLEVPNSVDFLIKPEQTSARSIHLYTRLAYLAYDCGEYPWRFSDYLASEEKYLTKIVDSRNYYTHYSQDKKDKAFNVDELGEINQHLVSLLQYHIMRILGFDAQYACGKCK